MTRLVVTGVDSYTVEPLIRKYEDISAFRCYKYVYSCIHVHVLYIHVHLCLTYMYM